MSSHILHYIYACIDLTKRMSALSAFGIRLSYRSEFGKSMVKFTMRNIRITGVCRVSRNMEIVDKVMLFQKQPRTYVAFSLQIPQKWNEFTRTIVANKGNVNVGIINELKQLDEKLT